MCAKSKEYVAGPHVNTTFSHFWKKTFRPDPIYVCACDRIREVCKGLGLVNKNLKPPGSVLVGSTLKQNFFLVAFEVDTDSFSAWPAALTKPDKTLEDLC